jgi:uncharacterized protein
MKEHFRILAELKKVDDKVIRLQTELERLPKELKSLDDKLSHEKEQFTSIKSTCDELEKKQRRAEGDLKEKEEYLRKAEGKMMEVKTNEEYQAALKENETHKQDKGKLEEVVLQVISQLELQRTTLKEAEDKFKAAEKSILEERKVLEEERKKLATHYEELLAKQSSVKQGLPPHILVVYNRLNGRMKGGVIASAEGGMCRGCNMRVQPQLYNEMLGFKAIHRCGSCGRILVVNLPEDAPQTS